MDLTTKQARKYVHAIELALETTTVMRGLNPSQHIQVGQFTVNNNTFNFYYDRSSGKGTYRNNETEDHRIHNDYANMYFETNYLPLSNSVNIIKIE